MKYAPITFPKDELPHDMTTEWWYFNGNLVDNAGNRYSYMNTLFKVKFPKVLFKSLENVPSGDGYFYHSMITRIDDQVSESHIDHVVKVRFDTKAPNLKINFGPLLGKEEFEISKTDTDKYYIKGKGLELDLVTQKKPILVGGKGFVDNVGEETYYYSFPSLETKGSIELAGKKLEVTGSSWMDHQWGDFPIPRGYWSWFCVQLDNNIQIICYENGNKSGSKTLATISFGDNKQVSTEEVIFDTSGDVWKSTKTKESYDLGWEINIPKYDISLQIEAPVKDQEVVYSYIRYWEGPININGKVNGQKVTGLGFMELARFR